MTTFGFQRGERLKSRKEIERLFAGGSQSVAQYPLRLVWRPVEERRSEFPVQMTVTVPKKRFKHAVSRNRIKRLLREAYRLHKPRLYASLPPDGEQLAWMIMFVGKDIPEFKETDKAMRTLVDTFLRQLPPPSANG